ncbi:hypothetical protein AC578_9947 [Pseudocercospora eumusae]|uniref:Uncharacterized protein n=1 Tax=Pseudocercospora eumusae TaxID=321146 RepID=A0A139H089_9PEZI|nr:hypothetical protein AC578_9947 [Pseudocercospora eumusae]
MPTQYNWTQIAQFYIDHNLSGTQPLSPTHWQELQSLTPAPWVPAPTGPRALQNFCKAAARNIHPEKISVLEVDGVDGRVVWKLPRGFRVPEVKDAYMPSKALAESVFVVGEEGKEEEGEEGEEGEGREGEEYERESGGGDDEDDEEVVRHQWHRTRVDSHVLVPGYPSPSPSATTSRIPSSPPLPTQPVVSCARQRHAQRQRQPPKQASHSSPSSQINPRHPTPNIAPRPSSSLLPHPHRSAPTTLTLDTLLHLLEHDLKTAQATIQQQRDEIARLRRGNLRFEAMLAELVRILVRREEDRERLERARRSVR